MGEDARLEELLEDLARALEQVPDVPGLTSTQDGRDLKADVLLYLRVKLLPELRSAEELPILVSVQGGTNTGKSTVFNALAGKLLSPAQVQGSATKHPLLFVHERWRRVLLAPELFAGLSLVELEDPKELLSAPERTDLLYLRFHDDDSLRDLALIDSPDFDSVLRTNLEVARTVTALSDITVFVTTREKYRDRELIAHLRLLAGLKAFLVIAFNMVEQEIVYETVLDDLRGVVRLRPEDFIAVRIPLSRCVHPEDDVRRSVQHLVLERLRVFRSRAVKPVIIQRTIARLLESVEELAGRFTGELALKEETALHLERELEEACKAYDDRFGLSLPEETLAVRRLLALTELGPRLGLSRDLEASSKGLSMVGQLVRGLHEKTRLLFLRLSRSDEGAIRDAPESIGEYARARDHADYENVLRAAETVRLSVEGFLRGRERASPLAHRVLATQFGTDQRIALRETLRAAFDEEVAARRREGGEHVRDEVERWIAGHPYQSRAVALGAISVKAGAGVLLARALPPAGIFDLWNIAYFAAGYLLAAYAVALVVSLVLKRTRRFRRARRRALGAVLERAVAEPIRGEMERIAQEKAVRAMERSRAAIANHPRACGRPDEQMLEPASGPSRS